MSSVHHAVHVETGVDVALKILPRSLAKNPILLQRFMREAKSAESLQSPNIASIYDRGFDAGRHYLVLEYIEGGDLHERVRDSGPMSIPVATSAIRSVAEGLGYAAGLGLIHRDIKPANLLLTPEGRVKIIDLGLALQTESEDERVTRDGTTVGTVDYMSPEQARDSRATTVRSDMYSLGCTFYYLLTGSPPYPGGDIPDKLGRHCAAAVPDVRVLRPEVGDELAILVARMMAKKPEGRFADYPALIAAIDGISGLRRVSPSEDDATPMALLDEDDEETPGASTEPDAFELVDEDDEDPSPPRPKDSAALKVPVDIAAVVSLADLAAIDDGDPKDRTGSARTNPTTWSRGRSLPRPDTGLVTPEPAPTVPSRHNDVPLSTWIVAGAVLGLVIAFAGFGVIKLFETPAVTSVSGELVTEEGGEPVLAETVPRDIPPRDLPRTKLGPDLPPAPLEPAAWVEPLDPVAPIPPEAPLPASLVDGVLPDWARTPVPISVEGRIAAVRRIPERADGSEYASIRAALDRDPVDVEVADSGPFYEADLRYAGRTQVIRARPGYRPMIKLQTSSVPSIRDRPAIVVVDGTRLILRGIDFVVDAKEFPAAKASAFLVRGGELDLVDCTITVLNGSRRPFSVVRVEDSPEGRETRHGRVRLDRTFVRGHATRVFDVVGFGDAVVERSVLLVAGEAVYARRDAINPDLPTPPPGLEPPARRDEARVSFLRSVIGSRGSILDLTESKNGPVAVRSAGSTFAKVAGLDRAAFALTRVDERARVGDSIRWSGDENRFVGWPGWLGVAGRSEPILSGLGAVREVWAGTSLGDRESSRGWPAPSLGEETTPANLATLEDGRPDILGRVAAPWPVLLYATIGSIFRLPVPELPGRVRAGVESTPGEMSLNADMMSQKTVRIAPQAAIGQPAKGTTAPEATVPPSVKGEIVFRPGVGGSGDDLGRLLARRELWLAGRLTVRIEGGGTWPMTPVTLPDGVSLTIAASSPSAIATFVAPPGASGDGLISLRGGELKLEGIGLGRHGDSAVSRLIAVEGGNLVGSRLILRSTGPTNLARSGLILFRAATTRPLPRTPGGASATSDLPTCSIVDSILACEGGEGIAAELGRGVVSLVNCVIFAPGSGAALALRPQAVARSRFEADLALDRCTIASEGTFLSMGPWLGSSPGPDRPWLVSTHRTAFLEVVGRGRREAVLFRSIGEGLAQDGLLWQSSGDAYDVSRFTASGNANLGIPSRPDFKAQWVDLWGAHHVESALGPQPRSTEPTVPIKGGPLRPESLNLDAIRIDPKLQPDLGVDPQYLPREAARTGITGQGSGRPTGVSVRLLGSTRSPG